MGMHKFKYNPWCFFMDRPLKIKMEMLTCAPRSDTDLASCQIGRADRVICWCRIAYKNLIQNNSCQTVNRVEKKISFETPKDHYIQTPTSFYKKVYGPLFIFKLVFPLKIWCTTGKKIPNFPPIFGYRQTIWHASVLIIKYIFPIFFFRSLSLLKISELI